MKNRSVAVALFATMTISGQAQLFNRQPTPNDTLQSVRQLTNGDVLLSATTTRRLLIPLADFMCGLLRAMRNRTKHCQCST